jgi:outer membrane autotransporter protein
MAALLATALLLPIAGYPQTLDDAVSDQLEINPSEFNFACERLLNGNPAEVADLVGGLSSICSRNVVTPGTGPANSTGGGAATPTTLPSIVQQRLREARGEEKKTKATPKTSGASADHVAKLGGRLNIFHSGEYKGLNRTAAPSGNGYGLDIRRLTAGAGYKDTDRVVRRPEDNLPKIAKASYPGSRTLLTHQQYDSLAILQAQPVMGASSGTTNRKAATFELAMDPLRITGVEIQEATANSAIVRIQANQSVASYNTFVLDSPPRIVIDIQGALMAESMSRKATGKGPIKRIRSSQYRRTPKPVVRVVLDLNSILPYQVAGIPETFRILIGEAVAKAGQVQAPRPPPEIATGPIRVTGAEIQEATFDSAIIRIRADQPVASYKASLLDNPPRIVIDIAGAFMAESMSRKATGKGPIKQIRSSQYRHKPEPVVRVVLDLAHTLPYLVVGLPDTFRLLIGEAVTKADQVKPPQPPPVTAERPKPAPEELRLATEPMEPFWRGVGAWGSGEYEALDRDATAFEDGYNSDIWRVTVGADYQFTDRILAGLAFDYYQQDGDFDRGGGFDIKSLGLIGFGSFLPTDKTFIQFYGGYARNEYDRTRIATFTQFSGVLFSRSGSPNADYDADQYSAGILGGYDFTIRNVTIGPRVGFEWIHTDFETYSEDGGSGLELTFHDDDQTLLQTSVGVQALISFSTDFGVVVPHASFDWKHEFDNDQRTVEVSFVDDTRAKRFTYETENPDRDWFEINAGVVTALPNGLQLFGNYRTIVGHSFFDSHTGTIGLRYSF